MTSRLGWVHDHACPRRPRLPSSHPGAPRDHRAERRPGPAGERRARRPRRRRPPASLGRRRPAHRHVLLDVRLLLDERGPAGHRRRSGRRRRPAQARDGRLCDRARSVRGPRRPPRRPPWPASADHRGPHGHPRARGRGGPGHRRVDARRPAHPARRERRPVSPATAERDPGVHDGPGPDPSRLRLRRRGRPGHRRRPGDRRRPPPGRPVRGRLALPALAAGPARRRRAHRRDHAPGIARRRLRARRRGRGVGPRPRDREPARAREPRPDVRMAAVDDPRAGRRAPPARGVLAGRATHRASTRASAGAAGGAARARRLEGAGRGRALLRGLLGVHVRVRPRQPGGVARDRMGVGTVPAAVLARLRRGVPRGGPWPRRPGLERPRDDGGHPRADRRPRRGRGDPHALAARALRVAAPARPARARLGPGMGVRAAARHRDGRRARTGRRPDRRPVLDGPADRARPRGRPLRRRPDRPAERRRDAADRHGREHRPERRERARRAGARALPRRRPAGASAARVQ